MAKGWSELVCSQAAFGVDDEKSETGSSSTTLSSRCSPTGKATTKFRRVGIDRRTVEDHYVRPGLGERPDLSQRHDLAEGLRRPPDTSPRIPDQYPDILADATSSE
jgi:hypothetical protein